MKRIISATLLSGVALMLLTACGGSTPSTQADTQTDAQASNQINAPKHKDPALNENTLYVGVHNNEKLAKVIEKAATQAGWKITPFKTNAVIAEKLGEENTHATTLKFSDGHIEFDHEAGTTDADIQDLRNAIAESAREKPVYAAH